MTPPTSTLIRNVRVFDGAAVGEPRTVVISNGVIAESAPDGDVETIDADAGVLLPGLIDAHVHIDTREDLGRCVAAGITTVIDMGTRTPRALDLLRYQSGLPSLLSAGVPASAPGGLQTKKMGFPPDSAIADADHAARFVAERVAEGSDFIKVIVEDPRMPGTAALPPATIAALVAAAHEANRIVVAHAVTSTAVQMAGEAGVDAITHVPVNRPLSAEEAASFVARGVVLIPTLTMMRDTTAAIGGKPVFRLLRGLRIAPPVEYTNSRQSVQAAYAAGMTVIAGTDANNEAGAPAHPRHGTSLHEELSLLVEAGLTAAQALNSATAAPARFFELSDRGTVAAGLRADLVLVQDDPTKDIDAVRKIVAVWVAGARISDASAAELR